MFIIKTIFLIAFASCIIQVYHDVTEIRRLDKEFCSDKDFSPSNRSDRRLYKTDMKMFVVLSLIFAILHSIL